MARAVAHTAVTLPEGKLNSDWNRCCTTGLRTASLSTKARTANPASTTTRGRTRRTAP